MSYVYRKLTLSLICSSFVWNQKYQTYSPFFFFFCSNKELFLPVIMRALPWAEPTLVVLLFYTCLCFACTGVIPRVKSGRFMKLLPDYEHMDYKDVYTHCMWIAAAWRVVCNSIKKTGSWSTAVDSVTMAHLALCCLLATKRGARSLVFYLCCFATQLSWTRSAN